METKKGYSITGKETKYIKAGYSKGKKYFTDKGYQLCKNKNFMEKDGHRVHYNSVSKIWIID